MALSKALEKYHKMSPKDVGLQATMPIQISRTVAESGEQMTMEVPIYPDDSRDSMNDRINFALSVMQDRLENVNAAILEAKVKADKANQARIAVSQVRALEKRFKKGTIKKAKFDEELAELNEKFGDVMAGIELENKTDSEVLSEDPQS